MTKKLLITAGVALSLVTFTSVGMAGDYHTGIKLICSDCHTMHYSQQHGYNANGGGDFTPLGASGPYEYLLRNDINDLCLSCHDGQSWAPDVAEAHGNGYVRQAGALNVVGGNGQYPPTTGHTLGSTANAPGSNPTWSNPAGLECINCHAAHGSGSGTWNSYRNLGGYGTAAGSTFQITYSRGDVEGSNDVTKWVYEDASSGVSSNHYGRGHLTFNEPDAATSMYGSFCKSCHTNFHGAVGGTEIGGAGSPASGFHRHPAAGVNIGAVGGGHSSLSRLAGKGNQVQVMSSSGARAKPEGSGYTSSMTDLTPSCFSCHKGHGNQNAFGLIYMLGTGSVDEQGDAGVDARNMCRQCHGMGGSATTY